MTDRGLAEVSNPSELFLAGRDLATPGTAVFAGMEGTRPLLVEIQALVAPTALGTPRRAVVGWDQSRLAMVLAVLEAHGGLRLGMHDVYLNVAGGLRITEPAADLAAAAALVSSLTGSALPPDTVYFGEVGLSGAIRPVAQAPARLKEAAKLGFARAVSPAPRAGEPERKGERAVLGTAPVAHIADLVAGVASIRPKGKPALQRAEG
jgi:DNA repair protein RadA/Sms